MAPEGKNHNYYDVLGLPRNSSEEEIRKMYLEIVRTLHPDKSRKSGSGMERFHEVQAAWRCLSDPTRRLMYDLRTFGDSAAGGTAEMGEMLLSRQKDQAALDLRNMEVELQRIVQKEQKRRGVLVRKALYGNLQLRPELLHAVLQGERPIQPEELQGPWIDVTSAVQCLVEQSIVRVHGSATYSKADLPGFYNPTPLNSQVELSLYVLYDFRETLHEVIVDDRESLTMPLRKHLVSGDHPRGPFPSSNVELLLRRRQLEAEVASPCSSPRQQATRRVTNRRIRTSEEELQRAVKCHTLLRMQGPSFEPLKREFYLLLGASTALVILLAVQRSL